MNIQSLSLRYPLTIS